MQASKKDRRTHAEWANDMLEHFPDRWKKRFLKVHESGIDDSVKFEPGYGLITKAVRAANSNLRGIVDRMDAVRLPIDASDNEIIARANELAAAAWSMGQVFVDKKELRASMERVCKNNHVSHPSEKMDIDPAIKRMCCPSWWVRKLRNLHASVVEGAAIEFGYVNKAADCYVSNESFERRRKQNRRNQRMLESTLMRNDKGQEYTLAELAAAGVANKSIRRGELMTRIAGFELIARESGHECVFVTATCPSRMHKWSAKSNGRKVSLNGKYDGTSPKKAQEYLSGCWAKIRAKLKRDGVGVYGFRIAEPHHDGCPHWHFLLFCVAGKVGCLENVCTKYFLEDCPDEAGAKTHRCKFKDIDLSAGSAAGYIAKYIGKNIDGYRVGKDLHGNDSMESSARVEAWAATWGIRQFQQIGGAPVGVWRELRRVNVLPDDAPESIRAAHEACNRVVVCEGAEGDTVSKIRAATYAGYCRAQGGVFVGRKHIIHLAKEDTNRVGRYGEDIAPVPVGVSAPGLKKYMIGRFEACAGWFMTVVRSSRGVWKRVFSASSSFGVGWG